MTKLVMDLFNYSGIKVGKEYSIMQALLDHLKAQPELKPIKQHIIETPAGSDICERCGVYTSHVDDCKCHVMQAERKKFIAMLERELGGK